MLAGDLYPSGSSVDLHVTHVGSDRATNQSGGRPRTPPASSAGTCRSTRLPPCSRARRGRPRRQQRPRRRRTGRPRLGRLPRRAGPPRSTWLVTDRYALAFLLTPAQAGDAPQMIPVLQRIRVPRVGPGGHAPGRTGYWATRPTLPARTAPTWPAARSSHLPDPGRPGRSPQEDPRIPVQPDHADGLGEQQTIGLRHHHRSGHVYTRAR
jgi:hypothetical protein